MGTGKNKQADKKCFGQATLDTLNKKHFLIIADEFPRISYSFLDVKNEQCNGLCSLLNLINGSETALNLTNKIKDQTELQIKFARTTLLFSNRYCTLIPEEVYRKEDEESYINLIYGDSFSGIFYSMHLPELGNYLVYKIPVAKDSMYRDLFPGLLIYHGTGYLLSMISRISFDYESPLVHAHFLQDYFELMIFSKGKLLFYNSFDFRTSEEIAYYILFAIKQWEIEVKTIMVSGLLYAESDELYWLKKYIHKIVPFPTESLLPFPASIENPLNYINLLNPELCE